MNRTDYYEKAISFALDQPSVESAIKAREADGYTPVGVNMRLIYSQKLKRRFIQINFDFYKQNANHNIREDIVVWLARENNQYKLQGLRSVHEVPDGLT
jgi:hypothetical protein